MSITASAVKEVRKAVLRCRERWATYPDSGSDNDYHRDKQALLKLWAKNLPGNPPPERNTVSWISSIEAVLYADTLLEKLGALQPPPQGANTPPTGTERGEGGKLRIPQAEAEIFVREWLKTYAKENPASITRDDVAAGTGVSTGAVSKTAAWKAFRKRRDAEAKPGAREVPLTETMQAVIPADCARPDELAEIAELVKKSQAEEAEQKIRHKRRHGPS